MVVRMRHTRAHTANRRIHHALKGTRLTVAKDGTVHPRHKALLDGTQYRGRVVLDTGARRSTRKVKADKRRQKETGEVETPKEEKAA